MKCQQIVGLASLLAVSLAVSRPALADANGKEKQAKAVAEAFVKQFNDGEVQKGMKLAALPFIPGYLPMLISNTGSGNYDPRVLSSFALETALEKQKGWKLPTRVTKVYEFGTRPDVGFFGDKVVTAVVQKRMAKGGYTVLFEGRGARGRKVHIPLLVVFEKGEAKVAGYLRAGLPPKRKPAGPRRE